MVVDPTRSCMVLLEVFMVLTKLDRLIRTKICLKWSSLVGTVKGLDLGFKATLPGPRFSLFFFRPDKGAFINDVTQ